MANKIYYILSCLLFSISTLSCASTNLNFSKDARDTFVKIKQNVKITICNPENKKECVSKSSVSSGSGSVVRLTDEGSYVLTAGHVCTFDRELQIAAELNADRMDVQMKAINFKMGEYVADIIAVDETIDTCILFAHNLYTTKVAKLAPKIKKLEVGERVYNAAAPVGIFYENVVPLLEGFFMGNRDTRAYYSIPAMGGSSGSPIFNSDDEIVGMIHSVNVYFPVVSVSPPLDELREFIKNSIKKGERLRLKNETDPESFWDSLRLSPMSKPSDSSL